MMAIDCVAQLISYNNLNAANVATLVEPTQHVLGEQVKVVIVHAESVGQGVQPRSDCNRVLDHMFSDVELQCDFAEHKSWRFLGSLIEKHLRCFFKDLAEMDLETVRRICLNSFQLLRLDARRRGRLINDC